METIRRSLMPPARVPDEYFKPMHQRWVQRELGSTKVISPGYIDSRTAAVRRSG